MDIELKELSNIYLQTLKEEEDGAAGEGQNPQQSADVGSHAKAIRYQARRDNVPLPKAFNDYVSKNQLSGSERTALRQKLGFMGEEVECNNTKEGEECPVHGMKACPMDEEEHKIGGGNLKKMSSKANKRVDADVDGDVDTKDMKSSETGEFVPGLDGKKVKSKFRAEHVFWRTELSEYTDASPKAKTDEESREKITEKKVKNKIVINPPQGMTEAIEELGGQILEMVEIEEGDFPKDAPSIKDAKPTKKTDVKYDPHMKVMAPTVKKEEVVDEAAGGIIGGAVGLMKTAKAAKAVKGISTAAKLASASSALAPAASSAAPLAGAAAAGAAGGYALGKSTNKKKQVTTTTTTEEVGSTSTGSNPETKKQLATKEQMMKKQHLLDKQRMQAQKTLRIPSSHMEELSIDQQMKISRDAAKNRKPYQPGDRQKQRAAQIKQMAKNAPKDTRTDDQKMTDATGPRPGSRYRGD